MPMLFAAVASAAALHAEQQQQQQQQQQLLLLLLQEEDTRRLRRNRGAPRSSATATCTPRIKRLSLLSPLVSPQLSPCGETAAGVCSLVAWGRLRCCCQASAAAGVGAPRGPLTDGGPPGAPAALFLITLLICIIAALLG